MSRINGVEERKATPRRPKHDFVVDEFKAFRQLTKHLIEWHEKGVDAAKEYSLDVTALPEEDEKELNRYLRADEARTPGSLAQDMYVRLRDRAHRMGILHHKVRVHKSGTQIILVASPGEKRRKRFTWDYVKAAQ